MTINKDAVQLFVNSANSGEGNEKIKAQFNSEAINISFNSKYLLDIASQIQGKEIKILLSDSASPALITDPDQDGVIFVLMPMRVWFSIRFNNEI